MDVLGDRDAGEAAPPRYHSAHASTVWSRIGASEPAAQPAKAAAPVSHAPAARVNAAGELPGLVVADGVCTVDGQEEAPDAVRGTQRGAFQTAPAAAARGGASALLKIARNAASARRCGRWRLRHV